MITKFISMIWKLTLTLFTCRSTAALRICRTSGRPSLIKKETFSVSFFLLTKGVMCVKLEIRRGRFGAFILLLACISDFIGFSACFINFSASVFIL